MDDKEFSNVFAIPANYTDSGKILGGMLEPRNAVEALVLIVLVGYPELMLIPMPSTIRIVVMTVTLIPLGVVAMMGIDGDSLFQYLGHIIYYMMSRRKLTFRRVGYKYDPAQLRKRKKRRKKPEKLEFVQDFIPIKDLRHGIIETTDGRYIKILEIEPINFMLRSDDEQFSIISTFASWLKISPMKLQFKSITRRADSDKHVAMVREELEAEPSEECKRLGEDYINLIKDVGSREALTRRFFLIFQYEEIRRSDSDDFSQIFSMMQTAEQNARAYFMQCGNNILQPEDPDEATAEILYMFFNRRSCIDEPFSSRVERVVVDTMAAKNKIIGIDEVPHIRFAHFIAPRGIDLKHHNYVIIDGLYYTFLYIKGDGYPSRVRAGWMSALINAGEGVDIDVHLRRENRSKTIDKVAQRIRLNRTKIKSMQDTSTDYEELANSIQAGYYIKHGIAIEGTLS